MSLKGNLQSVDLANVLQMLSINQKEGTLVLFDGDTRKSIYFSRDGVSMLSRGRKGQDSLGRILLRYGKIDQGQLDQALELQKAENRRLGEVLEAMGATTGEDVQNAIRTQIEEEIYNLFIWKEASFEFVEGPPPAARNVPAQVTFNVNSLIMEAQRRADEWNFIRGLVPSLDEIYKPTEKLSEAQVTDDVFHLPFAARLLEIIQNGRLNVNELIEESCAAKFEACKILAILLEQGAIEPVSFADLQSMAQEATGRGEPAQAAKFLSRIVDLGGATPSVNMSLGYALEAMDEPERASIYLKAAAEAYAEAVEPAHAFEALIRVGRSLPTDLRAVTQLVELACNNPGVLTANRHEVIEAGRTLARCLRELGRLPAALQILHRLAQASPQDLPLRNMLIQAYQDSGMAKEAIDELEAVAESCAAQKNYDEAIRCLRRVTSIDRNRPGAMKKIEALSRMRDRGKRLLMRVIAAGAVLGSIGAAAWGFWWYQEGQRRHREEIDQAISDRLDPVRARFDAAQKKFTQSSRMLENWRESAVESLRGDVAAMTEAVKVMEEALATTDARARELVAEHGPSGHPPKTLPETRTAYLRAMLTDARNQRESDLNRIAEGAREIYRRERAAAEQQPIGRIPGIQRAVGILQAVGSPTTVRIENRTEDAQETLKQLHSYRAEVETVQKEADALWAEGKRRESRDRLAHFLARFNTVTEFQEMLVFRLRVETIPRSAGVRVFREGAMSEETAPTPLELPYTAALGLRFEVRAEGFETQLVEVRPLKAGFNRDQAAEGMPFAMTVVLPKVPVRSLDLGAGGVEAAPVPSGDGEAFVIADRAGWIHWLPLDTSKEGVHHDARSLSGFNGAPAVQGDSVYAGSLDGVLLALEPGSLAVRWRIPAEEGPGPVHGSPLVVGDLVVFASSSGRVQARRGRTGDLAWEVLFPAGIRRTPAFVKDWIVSFCDDGRLRVVSPDGREVITVLPSPRDEASFPSPLVGPIPAGDKVLVGLDGLDQEISLIELPVKGAASPHIGYRWGVRAEGAGPHGAVLDGEEAMLFFDNGTARRASLRVGSRPGDLPTRFLEEKSRPLGPPLLRDGVFYVSSDRAVVAFTAASGTVQELWKWTAPPGSPVATAVSIVGRYAVVCTRDGRVHILLKD